jgi:hypothetical protein
VTAPTKADAAAADRLLKAAVRRAVSVLAYQPTVDGSVRRSEVAYAEGVLTAAGESAALLLGEAS